LLSQIHRKAGRSRGCDRCRIYHLGGDAMSRSRQEFSRKTKAEAFARAKGKCESCGVKIRPGNGPHYDHRIPDAVDGGTDLSNCQVLCNACHGVKTDDADKPEIARTK